MVFTPTQRAHTGPGGCPSPLILATHPPSFSPLPSAALHSATSGSSTPNSAIPPIRRFSTSSFSKLSEFHLDDDPEPINGAAANGGAGAGAGGSAASIKHMTPSRQASYNSVSGLENGVKGVRYVDLSLDPSEWRVHVFKKKVLAILRKLRVPRWDNPDILSSYVHLQKVSGAMTNAVFFVSFNPSRNPTSPSMSPLLTPTMPPSDPDLPLSPAQFPPTLLLRIYGPSSDALISRTEELRILHVLSTQYGLGPKVFGTFANGRVEQFFPSRALTSQELRDKAVSRGIARRMRELHSVDMMALGYQEEDLEVPTVWKSINEWIPAAKEVLTTLGAHGGRWEMWVENVALHRLPEEIETYKKWMMEQEPSRLVFAHNDTQYGNLLLLENPIPGSPDHYKYIVIDFEYAAPNPRGYDIANHFHEWRANYHHATLSHSLQPHYPYPSPEARENFYRAYLSLSIDPVKGAEGEARSGNGVSNGAGSSNGSVPTAQFRPRKDIEQEKVDKLEREVRAWSPAASAFWALWGIIQAEEMIANMDKEHEFDYLAYASERLDMFRKEAKELGVPI